MLMVIATAGLAEIPEAAVRELELALFLISLSPAVVYFLAVAICWGRRNWADLRKWQISGRALAILAALCVPEVLWLKFFVVWPYWWWFPRQ